MIRSGQRSNQQLRPHKITRSFTKNPAGSVLIQAGETYVLCTASVESRVPFYKRGTNQGWVTAEYSMLPGSTKVRSSREAARGRQGGRTMEIQRLIGRSLRACIDLEKLGERTIVIDCDVLQADAGTRCASITGGYVALVDAVASLLESGAIEDNPIYSRIAAVSVGIVNGSVMLDLDYSEDSIAETDMNVVMNEFGNMIEIQGTAEERSFSVDQLIEMTAAAQTGIAELIELQDSALSS